MAAVLQTLANLGMSARERALRTIDLTAPGRPTNAASCRSYRSRSQCDAPRTFAAAVPAQQRTAVYTLPLRQQTDFFQPDPKAKLEATLPLPQTGLRTKNSAVPDGGKCPFPRLVRLGAFGAPETMQRRRPTRWTNWE
jgi:hypothetical protein